MVHHSVGQVTGYPALPAITGDSALAATVDAVIQEITRGRESGLICVRCGDEEEAVAALVTLCWDPPEQFALCGLCYREFRDLALGEVT